MSLYRYSTASTLSEVHFHYAVDKAPVALLCAKTGTSADQLSAIRRTLESSGMQCVPVFTGEREVLQVVGFKDAGQLNALLLTHQFVAGRPQITEEASDHQTRNWKGWLQRYSLKTVGWLNIIGDIGLLASGLTTKGGMRNYHIAAGSLYTVGAAVPALFGEVNSENQVNETLARMNAALKEQSVEVPKDSSLYAATQDQRTGMRHFLHQHAAQAMLGFYALGAGTMLAGGLRVRDAQGKLNPYKIAYGANSLGLKTLSLALPEKATPEKDENKGQRDPISGAFHWLVDKPLRLFGIGSFISDGSLGLAAMRDYRNALKINPGARPDYFQFLTTGTYLAADVLASLSSKDPSHADGKFNADQQQRIEAMAAETIIRQPEAVREGLVNRVADAISKQGEMSGGREKISHSISEQIKHMESNPWAQRTSADPAIAETEQKHAR